MSKDHILCDLEDISEGSAKSFLIEIDGSKKEVLIVRKADQVFGYLNWCPHRGTPLDWLKDNFLDRGGHLIVCATHGAYFRIEDGKCVSGPCVGDRLRPYPVEVTNGIIRSISPL